MSRVPSPRELEVLRYLAAGMRIGPCAGANSHPVIAKRVTVIRIRYTTVLSLAREGWIAGDADGSWTITTGGRDVVDVKALVRAFAEGATA